MRQFSVSRRDADGNRMFPFRGVMMPPIDQLTKDGAPITVHNDRCILIHCLSGYDLQLGTNVLGQLRFAVCGVWFADL